MAVGARRRVACGLQLAQQRFALRASRCRRRRSAAASCEVVGIGGGALQPVLRRAPASRACCVRQRRRRAAARAVARYAGTAASAGDHRLPLGVGAVGRRPRSPSYPGSASRHRGTAHRRTNRASVAGGGAPGAGAAGRRSRRAPPSGRCAAAPTGVAGASAAKRARNSPRRASSLCSAFGRVVTQRAVHVRRAWDRKRAAEVGRHHREPPQHVDDVLVLEQRKARIGRVAHRHRLRSRRRRGAGPAAAAAPRRARRASSAESGSRTFPVRPAAARPRSIRRRA